jgi:hypothetical protein
MGPDLVEPVFLMPYSDADPVSDYRCVVNGSATRVIFERTRYDNGKVGSTRLYVLDLVSQPPVAPSKLNDVSPALRPDWCWYTGQITFMNPEAVYIQDTVSATPNALPNTPNMAYPTWSAAGDFIATENGETLPGIFAAEYQDRSGFRRRDRSGDGKPARVGRNAFCGPT